jgi:hypothetical protein
VFLDVDEFLFRIPFESHRYTYCITFPPPASPESLDPSLPEIGRYIVGGLLDGNYSSVAGRTVDSYKQGSEIGDCSGRQK